MPRMTFVTLKEKGEGGRNTGSEGRSGTSPHALTSTSPALTADTSLSIRLAPPPFISLFVSDFFFVLPPLLPRCICFTVHCLPSLWKILPALFSSLCFAVPCSLFFFLSASAAAEERSDEVTAHMLTSLRCTVCFHSLHSCSYLVVQIGDKH